MEDIIVAFVNMSVSEFKTFRRAMRILTSVGMAQNDAAITLLHARKVRLEQIRQTYR